jgi:hypothetical protein
MVTAPVSAGLVRVRMASSSAVGSWSGRLIRSQYFETALKASLTEESHDDGDSTCCSTGPVRRLAKMSLGRHSTGSRFTVAVAAPVTIFVAPGPIEVEQASAPRRFFILA